MAEDISKKITIDVELETDKLTENIAKLSKTIEGLLSKQQQLNSVGEQNSVTFDGISAKIDVLQKKLKDVTPQFGSNAAAVGKLGTTSKSAGNAVSSLATSYQKAAKAAGDSATRVKELSGQMKSLSQSVNEQKGSTDKGKSALDSLAETIAKGAQDAGQLQSAVDDSSATLGEQANKVTENKKAFDAHAITMEHLKTSFDEIKDVSGIFGPSLKDAAEGFSVMKSGLALVKDGLTGVGEAIKADGFDFLLQILQQMFDYFIRTSKGAKVLKGVISAIGVVVNNVKAFFKSFMNGIIDAFSHPMDTLKSLGRMIEQNIINRFTAFGKILDGLIHFDFKKVADGAIQATTGITDATDKVVTLFDKAKTGIENTAKEMVTAYGQGYSQADQDVKEHEKKVIKSVKRQIKHYKKLKKVIQNTYREDNGPLTANQAGIDDTTSKNPTPPPGTVKVTALAGEQQTADKVVAIKKTALQQVEEYAKQSADKIASDAFKVLSDSIKHQSEAKIAALEKDKAAELSNRSLTSAQKMAIEQKYKSQEAQVKAKAFKEEQEASIAQAVINGALAITKGTSQTGILAALYIPTIIAETAVQVAKIAAQKPPAYASGGLHYTSDGRGGVLPGYSRTDNTNAWLRSGEGVVVSEAMQSPWARNLVSAINVGFGGRDFSVPNPGRGYAIGGIFTDGGNANRYYNQPVHDEKNLANSIAYQMINNFPPVYVDVKDINNQQNILAQTVNRVNL